MLTACVRDHPARVTTFATWLSQGVTAASMVVLAPIMIASVGPEQAGVWFFILGTVAFFQLSDFGIAQSVARQIAYSRERHAESAHPQTVFLDVHGREACAEVFTAARRMFRCIGIGIVLAAIVAERTVLFAGRMAAGADHRATWYLAVLAVLAFFLARPYQAYLEGLLQQAWERLASALVALVANAALITTAMISPRLPLLGLILASGGVLHLAVVYGLTRHLVLRSGPFAVSPRPGLTAALWRASWPQGVTTLGVFGMLSTSGMMIGWLRGAGEVAAYHLPWRVANMGQLALVALALPQTAFLIDLARRGEHGRVRARVRRLLARIGCATVISFTVFVVAGPPVFTAWLGAELAIPRGFLVLLALWNALAVLQTVLWVYVIAYGVQRFAAATMTGAALNLALSVMLIPRFGLTGAAAATLVAQLATSNWWAAWLALRIARDHRPEATSVGVRTLPALAAEQAT